MDTTPSRLEHSPLNFLRRNARSLGQRPAVVHGQRRINYAELEERCNRLASALRDRGLERHDRVAILAPNTPALLEAHYGVPLAGGVLVAMNSRLGSDEIEYILDDSGARTLLVDAQLKEVVQPLSLDGIEIDAEGVTHYSGAPTIHMGIVNCEKAHPLEQHVTVPTGGSPPTPAVIRRMRELNLHPIHLYGLTETYGPAMGCSWQPQWNELDSEQQARLLSRQGHTYNGADEVRVVDEEMCDVQRDDQAVGEVVLRGNSVMVGYHGKDDQTEEAFRGGWYHSGDLAVWHPDGYVELRDRSKDIIISGGENISSIEVEQALAEHPSVLEAAVVATPDEKWGERPKAFVELRDGQDASQDDLISFCRDHLARFKCPAEIEFCELPRTSTGKIQKYVLREREWEGREKAIG
jgi:acyl-CoA synthetase (AMP-forming)/AMP-acid ligase II